MERMKYEDELNLYIRNLFFSEGGDDNADGSWNILDPDRIKGYCS